VRIQVLTDAAMGSGLAELREFAPALTQ